MDYCSRECQLKDLKRHKELCAPVVFKELDSRGRGLVATKDIPIGGLLLKEKAIINIASIKYLNAAEEYIAKNSESQYEHMMKTWKEEEKCRFLRLRNGSEFGEKIFLLDNFVSTETCHCLFLSICQLRHQCSPNATTNVVNEHQNLREVRAIKDIKKGDEVTINYLFTFPRKKQKYMKKEERKKQLIRWDVLCDCNHCLLGEEEDRIQELINIEDNKLQLTKDYHNCSFDQDFVLLQIYLVEKIQETYLAPILLPLECPQLMWDCYLAEHYDGMFEAVSLWGDTIEQRNVALFRKYYSMMLQTLKRMEKCQTMNESEKLFQDLFSRIQNNIF